MNFELKRKKFGRGIPNDLFFDIFGVASLGVVKKLPLMYVCLLESLCIPNRLRYGKMNGTMLSQIVRGMFLAHQVYQKLFECSNMARYLKV